MKPIRRILDLVAAAALGLAGTGMLAMTMVVGWHIFARYVLNDTPSWTEPVVLQLMGWFILLGSAVGVRESFHLGLDLFTAVMPPVVARVLDVFTLALTSVFGAAMAWYSTILAAGTWDARLPVLGLPGGVDFLPLVAGGVLIAVFAAERLVLRLAGVPDAAIEPELSLREMV